MHGRTGVLAWQTTWSFDVVAPGINDKNVVIVHTLDSGRHPGGDLSQRCTAEPADARPTSQVNGPCLLASIGGNKKAKTLIVHWYATHNGFGRGG